jgi:pyruvate formate lyase activating enzyme
MEDVKNLIRSRRDLADAVCITGGEPTLHEDLPDFIKEFKNRGSLVKLDTNGSNPEMLGNLLKENLLDYVAMDIKAPWEKYREIAGGVFRIDKIKKSATIILNSGIAHEFRSTVAFGLHSAEDIVEMARQVKGADRFFIQRFKPAEKLVDDRFVVVGKFTLKDLNDIKARIKDWFKICAVR